MIVNGAPDCQWNDQYVYASPLKNTDHSGRYCERGFDHCTSYMGADEVAQWRIFINERNRLDTDELIPEHLQYIDEYSVQEAWAMAAAWDRYQANPFLHYTTGDDTFTYAKIYWEYFLGARFGEFTTYTLSEEIALRDCYDIPTDDYTRQLANAFEAGASTMVGAGLSRVNPTYAPARPALSLNNIPVEPIHDYPDHVSGGGSSVGGGSEIPATSYKHLSWEEISGVIRDTNGRKGNFGLGSYTRSQTDEIGHAWVGDGARLSSNGKAWISSDGYRQYRLPSYKPKWGNTQANLEWRYNGSGKDWNGGNGHITIIDP